MIFFILNKVMTHFVKGEIMQTMTQQSTPHAPFEIMDFCKWAGIGKSTLYNLWKKGVGPKSVRIGGSRKIRREEAFMWLASLER